jgi:hypothetical protein
VSAVAPREARPSLVLRLAVWLRRPALDRALACGARGSAQLELRAAQLVRTDSRERIADWIELAMTAEAGRASQSRSLALQRVSVALAHAELVWLVAALRTTADPSPQAVAMALELVSDDAGPLYAPPTTTALQTTARRISGELLG